MTSDTMKKTVDDVCSLFPCCIHGVENIILFFYVGIFPIYGFPFEWNFKTTDLLCLEVHQERILLFISYISGRKEIKFDVMLLGM